MTDKGGQLFLIETIKQSMAAQIVHQPFAEPLIRLIELAKNHWIKRLTQCNTIFRKQQTIENNKISLSSSVEPKKEFHKKLPDFYFHRKEGTKFCLYLKYVNN